MAKKIKIYESAEDYLETILILSQKEKEVHAIAIAKELSFSKPSVSVALHKLERAKYINISPTGSIMLTNSGLKIAQKTYERHQILTKILMKLGVSEQTASKDACKIEHDISEETFEALKKIN